MDNDQKNLIITASRFGVCASYPNGVPLEKNRALSVVSKMLATLSSPCYGMYREEMKLDIECSEYMDESDE